MTREEQMWQAVEQEHGKISLREALIALTAMEWADKTMIEKACEYAEARYDLDYCGNVRDIISYLKSLMEE